MAEDKARKHGSYRIYVASGLENAARVREVQAFLRSQGHTITYDWTAHGSVQSEGAARIAAVARAEMDGVLAADLVVILLPGGRGTHTEMGMALADLTPVVIFGSLLGSDGRECAFYRAPSVLGRYSEANETTLRHMLGHVRASYFDPPHLDRRADGLPMGWIETEEEYSPAAPAAAPPPRPRRIAAEECAYAERSVSGSAFSIDDSFCGECGTRCSEPCPRIRSGTQVRP